jgi:Xaa-Pro aminopeptidase
MSAVISGPVEPASSGEIQISTPERGLDVEQKHRLVSEFLESHQYDALLLQEPGSFAWFTSGADCSRGGSSESIAALFITPEARVVMTSNVDSAQLFERELPGLGFQLKERPWYEPRHVLIEDVCRGRTVASDGNFGFTNNVSPQLIGLRLPLTVLECERLRELGRAVAHSVEASARNCQAGETEAEIAAETAHRLIKRQVIPERIQVCADGQNVRHRHWSFGTRRARHCCVISAVGRRWGLQVGATRTVCFGEPSDELRKAHHRTVLAHATGMYFCQPEWELFEVWNRVQRIYEKFGVAEEWRHADQAEIIGYQVTEVPIVPKSEFRLAPRMAVHWHPSVGPAAAGDAILVADDGFEVLTPMENWPKITVEVKGSAIHCPDILRRATADDISDDSVLE